jgi:hypothetical protein
MIFSIISIILLVCAGIFNACMDVLDFKYSKSIFLNCKNQQWINPSISWKNKWKNGDSTQGEKFFGSSTFLVWLTDLWHFSKFMMLLAICAAIILFQSIVVWWIDILILYCVFTIIFELFYSKIFIKS